MAAAKHSILVTGGTGFLGSHLLRRLVGRGHEVVLLRRVSSNPSRIADLQGGCVSYNREQTPLEAIFDRHPIETILHCATHYGRSAASPIPVIESNLILPLNLLHLGLSRGVKRFINSDTILDTRVNHYSTSKKQFLEWLRIYSPQLTCLNVALEHFYGPGDDPSKFVSSMVLKLLQGEKTIELTPGEQRRDFIYIDDVAAAFMKIIDWSFEQDGGFHQFEVGTGQTLSIRDFVELIKRLAENTETQLAFGALPYRASEVMESYVDLAPLAKLGFRPEVALEDGLRRTIEGERLRLLLRSG